MWLRDGHTDGRENLARAPVGTCRRKAERRPGEPYARTGGTRTHHSRVAGMHRLGLWTNRSGPSIGAEAEHFAVENAAAGNHWGRLQQSAARVGKLNPRATRPAEGPANGRHSRSVGQASTW